VFESKLDLEKSNREAVRNLEEANERQSSAVLILD
jgi:hypothetical protein